MLGLLHRIVLDDAPSQLVALFPFADARPHDTSTTRLAIRRHNRQFVQPTIGTEVLRRNLFGLVVVYNLLPQAVVDEKSVQSFQSSLQRALRNVARLGVPNWDCLFSPRLRPVRAFDFQRYFA